MQPNDRLLGLDRNGKPSWAPLLRKRKRRSRLVRILSDSAEFIVGNSCGIFTVNGLKQAYELEEGDLVETVTLTPRIRENLTSNSLSYFPTVEGPVALDEDLAYILGLQILAKKKTESQVIIDCRQLEKIKTITDIFTKTLDDRFISMKIGYVPRTTKIKLRSRAFSEISSDISRSFIPLIIRKSPPIVLRKFLCGILDSIIRVNFNESPSTYFATRENESHFRRCVFSMLRLFNIVPVKSYLFQSEGFNYVNSYVRTYDLKKLGLCFYWIRVPELSNVNQHQPTGYSQVRSLTSFSSDSLILTPRNPHWSIIADLAPLQPQVFD